MIALSLAAIAALILINGFFVAAEFALVSLARNEPRGESRMARVARRQHEKLDEYLSACQLGITIASLALGAIGEPTIAHLLEPVLHSVALAHVAGVIASILAILIMTTLHITVGEQAPKSFAIGAAPVVARVAALPLEGFYRALRPLVVVLNNASNGIVRLFGGTPASTHGQDPTLDELRMLIGGLAEEGAIDRTDAQMLRGVFTLDERRAEDVMTPRSRVVVVWVSQRVRDALEATRGTGHSRFPLLDARGELQGVIHRLDLADALLDGDGDGEVDRYRHEMLVVPPTRRLDELLATMQSRRVTICAVVDEFGQLLGVVTIEDILEEVVGEIWDEDDVPSRIRLLEDGRVVSTGDTSLTDLEEYGIRVPDDDRATVTIGGEIQRRLGRLARPGDRVEIGGNRVRVLSTERGQPKRIVIERPRPQPEPGRG
jgi:CBS domain containing-hemolysin-like protein